MVASVVVVAVAAMEGLMVVIVPSLAPLVVRVMGAPWAVL